MKDRANDASSPLPDPTREHHAPQFRGTFTPAEVHILLANGEIRSFDFVLLSVIDSLVVPHGDGCWASNEYLGSRTGKSADYVKRRIGVLKKKGLLFQAGWKSIRGKDHRVLETKWSRAGGAGKDTRGDFSPTLGGILVPHSGGLKSPQIDKRGEEEGRAGRRSRPRPRPCAHPPVLPLLGGGKGTPSKQRSPAPDFCREWGNRLLRILRTLTGVAVEAGTVGSRAEHFYDLWKRLGKDDAAKKVIQSRLDLFGKHAAAVRKPEISSAKQFCDPKLFNWLGRVLAELSGAAAAADEAAARKAKYQRDLDEMY